MENSQTSFNSRQIIIVVALCALAIGLRLAAMDRSYWLDEIVTVLTIDAPDWKTVLVATSHDNQPPLYNMTAFFWGRLFGYSEPAVRSLSLLFGLGALFTPWLARTSLGTNEKIFNCAVLCFMSYPIRYAQEARNYSLLFLLSCICLYSYYEINAGPRRLPSLRFYVAVALLALTHIFGSLLALSFIAVLFLRESSLGRRAGLAVFAMVLVAASLGPLLYGGAAKQAGGHFWIHFGPRIIAVEMLKLFTPVGIALLAYGLIRWRTAPRTVAWNPALCWTLLPFAMMLMGALVISFHSPIFMANYLIGMIPAYALLLCWLLKPMASGARPAALLLMFSLLFVQALALTFSPYLFVQEDLRQIARTSLADDSRVCYVADTGTTLGLDSVWSYYITRLGRSDLKAIEVPEADIPRTAPTRQCGLWADAHLAQRGVTAMRRYPQLAGCREVPLGKPGVAMASALFDCRASTPGDAVN